MDNKEAIKNIKDLKKWKYLGDRKYMVALDKAIASLEAWDKVIEEIEKNNPENYFSDKPIIITKKTVLETIEKYKKEIEE